MRLDKFTLRAQEAIQAAIELAERDTADGGDLSPEYQQVSKQLALGGQIAGFITALTIFFMVVKP